MTYGIVFVCAANICRSPLMAFTFAEALRANSDADAWTVTSGGVHVNRPAPMCEVSAGLLSEVADVDDLVGSHSATPIEAGHLDGQDLIIAASREERAALAQLRPAVRRRAFTLNEAVALGRAPITPEEIERALRRSEGGSGALSMYASLLNDRRGSLPLTPMRRFRLPWAEVADPQDVPDVHHGRLSRHRRTLIDVQSTTRQLQSQLRAFTGVATGA